MLNCILEGSLLTLFAWIVLRISRRQNSGTRFLVWFVVLLTIGLLPIIEAVSANAGLVSTAAHSRIVLPESWASYFFAAWALISLTGLAKLAAGFWRVRQLRESCSLINIAELDPQVQATLRNFAGLRDVAVYYSDGVSVPAAIGFFRPAVVLPRWVPKEMSAEELNAVLLHELAHVQRWDDWTNLAQKILRALFFFHPAVWWLEHKLALEREAACDDFVIAQTKNPRAYAECLVSMAEKGFLHRGIALAQAVVGKIGQTSLRLARILAGDRPDGTRIALPAVASVAVLAAATVVFLPHMPNLIAFQNTHSSPSMLPPALSASEVPVAVRTVHAKLTLPSSNIQSKRVPAKPRPMDAAVIPAKLKQKAAPRHVLRASVAPTPVPQEVVLVMESQESSAAGTHWTLCVWRLTIVQSANSAAPKENLPNKI